jgi:hypothetical protein
VIAVIGKFRPAWSCCIQRLHQLVRRPLNCNRLELVDTRALGSYAVVQISRRLGALLRVSAMNVQDISHDLSMKLHGYADTGLEPEYFVPDELAEVTLVATPNELRRMAAFLCQCADEMDRMCVWGG